jgi:hypothetical protein
MKKKHEADSSRHLYFFVVHSCQNKREFCACLNNLVCVLRVRTVRLHERYIQRLEIWSGFNVSRHLAIGRRRGLCIMLSWSEPDSDDSARMYKTEASHENYNTGNTW